MKCHGNIHEISGLRHSNIPVCPMKDSRSWSHISTRTIGGSYLKNFCQSIQKQRQDGKGKEEKATTIITTTTTTTATTN